MSARVDAWHGARVRPSLRHPTHPHAYPPIPSRETKINTELETPARFDPRASREHALGHHTRPYPSHPAPPSRTARRPPFLSPSSLPRSPLIPRLAQTRPGRTCALATSLPLHRSAIGAMAERSKKML